MILILLIVAIFGLVLSTILFFKSSTNTLATRILGSFYFLLSVYALQAYILDGGFLEHFRWFFLWPLLPYHLIFIPIYYYFKIILTDRLSWHPAELILFLPFFIGLIDVMYVYLQPAEFYNNIITEAITSPEQRLGAQYWLLSLDQHLLMRHLWQFGVLIVFIPQIQSFIAKGKDDDLKYLLDKWLLLFWGILMLMAVLAIIYALEKMFDANLFSSLIIIGKTGGVITFFLYLVLFLIGIVPIYFPSILYGYPQQIKAANAPRNSTEDLKFGLDEQEVELKFEELEKSRSCLNRDFSLTECARKLAMPSHHISYFLKQKHGLSFAAYKNKLRIDHAKQLIREGYLQNNTIEALAQECGFTGRTSFCKTFKNLEDVSPGEYALKQD